MLRSRISRAPGSKDLWQQLEPLIPPLVASRKGGRCKRTISDEAALNGSLYRLQTGIPWEDLPQALGYGGGMTCWRRLRDWNAAGRSGADNSLFVEAVLGIVRTGSPWRDLPKEFGKWNTVFKRFRDRGENWQC